MSLTAALADAPISPDLDSPLPAKQVGPRIFDRFLATCRERPDARAIVHSRGAWTYAEVDRASRALAHELLALPGTDDVVALYGKRSGELVVAMLACTRAGLTFAVLDAAYPIERIQLLLGVLAPGRFVAIDDVELAGLAVPGSVVRFDAERMTRDHAVTEGLDAVRPDAIAYLLFTSGTTGVPKCIATSHTPLVHFIDWYARTFAVEPSCRFSMLSGLGHDPVLRDIFVPLSTGAELHVPPPATVLDPVKLHGWFADSQITHTHVTPQLSRILCAGKRGQPLPSLRYVFSGGDVLRVKQATEIASLGPSTTVVNFYGSTETPQAMGFHVFDPRTDTSEAGESVVPIGRGIDDVQVFVLGDKLEPTDASGQIAIRTRYLSEGYRGDAGLTHAKFVANPRSTDLADRLYLTGDLGKRRPDGAVILEGRVDDQVKIRGFRVELGDVVHQLHQLPQIQEAVVLSEKLPDGEARLVAYAVGTRDTAGAREAMAASAPAYMVPARFVWLDAFPLLPNGKVDRGKLRGLEPAETTPAQDLDPTEAAIADHWRELLGRPSIDVDQSFVTLGGDSLSFIEASVKLEDLLGNLPEAWEKLSIRELAKRKRAERSKWTHVDASVFLRAVSIVAVVASHMALPNLAGSVLALFVVSGMSFGRYLGPQIQQSGTVTPIAKLVVKIGVPAAIYALVLNVGYHLPKWPGLLLANNLVHHDTKLSGMGFWYIDVLFQCFVVLALLLALRPVRRILVEGDPFHVLVAMTLLFVGIALAAQYFIDLSHLYDRTPLYYLRAVFLGWTLVYATNLPRRLIVVALTIPVFGDNAWNHEEDYVWFPFVATAFLAFVPRVTLPVWLGRVVTIVASASLFIYLTDHQTNLVLLKVAERAGIPEGVPFAMVMTVVAVVAGIVLYRVWDFAISRFAPRAVRGWL